GTCHAWLQAGGQPRTPGRVVQECGVGLVTLRQDGERLAFAAPPLIQSGPLDEVDVERIARGLGVARSDIVHHAWCHNGPHWRAVLLRSAEQVLGLRPDPATLGGLSIGVVGPRSAARQAADGCAFEVRAFFPGNHGLAEDPVTGSLNAALAQWLIPAHLAPRSYVVSQGTALGRAGRVHVDQEGAQTWIGGQAVTCMRGEVRL
ncbi:MAG TPA: PhzF family phenazine biosynthesis protein, partial [Giesbergeria sp.]|nr:PhzF family phenazine biosynthesis protein [Giesbergeria sp.]